MPVDETGAPPPAAALETAAPIAASVEAPAFAAVAPEVAVAEVALEAAQTDAHAGIQGLAGAEAQSVDYSKGIDARTADPALMEAFREEVKQANASGEDRPYADMLAKAQARAAETVDSDVAEEATQATSPATEAAEPAAETEEKTTKGYFELNAKDGGMGISDRAPNADAYRQVMQEMQTNGTVLTQAEIRDRVNQIVTGQVPEGAISGVGEEAVVTDLAEEPAAEASAGEPAAEGAIDTVVDAAEGAAAETKTAEGAVAEEPAPEAPADAATEAPAEVVVETSAGEAAPDSAAPVEEPAAVKPEAAATPVEESAVNATEDSSQTIEELRSDLAERGGFDAVTPAGKTSTGAAEANAEVVKETAATETPTEIVPPVVEATAVDGADAINETVTDTAEPAAGVIEAAVSGSPEATPDPNKPPIRVDSRGRRFADNGPGKNQPEYRSFQQAHAELITSGIPFTEDDVRIRAAELRTQELTEEQEKLQAAKKNESAPPLPNAPGGPEAGTNRPSPQAQRAEAIAKIDEQLKDKNLTEEQRVALMAQKQELRKDPDAEVKKLKEKFDNGEDLTPDELHQVAQFDARELQAAPAEATPNGPELTNDEKLDKLYADMQELGERAMEQLANQENATEALLAFQTKFMEASEIKFDEQQKEHARELIRGVINPTDARERTTPEVSAKRAAIREKLQHLSRLHMELMAIPKTLDVLKKNEKKAKDSMSASEGKLGKGNPDQQLAAQMEYMGRVDALAGIQDQVRQTEHKAQQINSERWYTLNYIHRKLGIGHPIVNMMSLIAHIGVDAAGYTAYNAASTI